MKQETSSPQSPRPPTQHAAATDTTRQVGDVMILRCPFCKARVETADRECPICGEVLTPQNVLRVKSSVKIFSRPLLPQADVAASVPQPTPPITEPISPAPAINKPRTEPLKPPRPFTQSMPRVRAKNSRHPSSYTVGLLAGFAVIVLGTAILVGVNLARQATTEAKATEDRMHQQAAKITVVYAEAEPTQTPVVPTVTPQPTQATQQTQLAGIAIVFTVTSSAPTTQPTPVVAPTQTPRPTVEIIPNYSPTPTRPPTLMPALSAPAPTKTAAKWQLTLASARYETAGRPTQVCSNFDANDTVRKFTFTLRITQTTGRDLAPNAWGVAAFVGDARVQQVCYFKTEGPTPPALLNGAERQITLSAFIGQGQSVTALVVGDTTGSGERLCVKDTQAVACP